MTQPETAVLQKLLRQQQSLRNIIASISAELELRPLLERIVHAAGELLDAQFGAIGLVDNAQNVVRTEVSFGIGQEHMRDEFEPNMGIFGTVYATHKPLLLEQYSDLENPTHSDMLPHAAIGLPIWWRGKMLGVFGLGSPQPRRFDKQDVDLLEQLAHHAAIAIANAQLYEAERRRTARQETLNQIGKLIARTLSLDDLLQTAVNAIRDQLTYSDTGLLLVPSDSPNELELIARAGLYDGVLSNSYRQPIGKGIVGRAAAQRKSILLPYVYDDPDYIPMSGAEDIISEIVVPIINGDELLGVINVEANRRLTQGEVPVLEMAADQLGVAIRNARLFQKTQVALAETRLLYETSQRISIAMDIDDVIEAYLSQVANDERFVCTVVLYEFDDDGEKTAVIVRGLWSQENGISIIKERFPYTRDTLDHLLDANQTVTMSNVFTDPRATESLRNIQRASQRPALALIPLISHGVRIGLVILSYHAEYQWTEDDLRAYQITAAQLATAINTRQQQEQLSERSSEVAVLLERQRLARELHDSVTQLIFSMTLIAQSIAPVWQRDPEKGRQRINRMLELSQSALAEMRALLFELRSNEPPPVPAETGLKLPGIARVRRDGLVIALEKHAQRIARYGPQIAVDALKYRSQPLDREIALFRITQEALNNIVKHAKANSVTIDLESDDEETRLTVADDGVGFELDAKPQKRDSFGLRTMRERAEALGGVYEISSLLGQGTVVQVRLAKK